MSTEQELKSMVQEKYATIALQDRADNAASCCGAGGCSTEVYNIMTDDYTAVEGYQQEADLGLGCGLPTQFANIRPGDVVIDLGSGAGNDCFIARKATGETGKVIGIDFTPAMISKARENAEKLAFHNVEFRQGDIEHMPVTANVADVIVSNCVLNLVPNKAAVIREIFRVLKPGAHFSIADVVLIGTLPPAIQDAAEMYAGCVSGAIQKDEYLALIHAQGFEQVTIQKEKPIVIPDDILRNYLDGSALADFQTTGAGIFSITVFARKPVDACSGEGCC